MKGHSEWWEARAAAVCAQFPLAATDWDQHSDCVDAGVYSVQKRSFTSWPAEPRLHNFADEPPLSPEEEEAAAASATALQMELF